MKRAEIARSEGGGGITGNACESPGALFSTPAPIRYLGHLGRGILRRRRRRGVGEQPKGMQRGGRSSKQGRGGNWAGEDWMAAEDKGERGKQAGGKLCKAMRWRVGKSARRTAHPMSWQTMCDFRLDLPAPAAGSDGAEASRGRPPADDDRACDAGGDDESFGLTGQEEDGAKTWRHIQQRLKSSRALEQARHQAAAHGRMAVGEAGGGTGGC